MVMLVVVVCKYVDEKWWFISVKWPHCLVYLSSTLTSAKQINSSVQETLVGRWHKDTYHGA